MTFNEYDQLVKVAVRRPEAAFVSEEKLASEWADLRFHSKPDLDAALEEHAAFRALLAAHGAKLIELPADDQLTLDSIYVRDATLVSPRGLIACRMGRPGRRSEPASNARSLGNSELKINAPGTLEGGDLIWLDEGALAVGVGPRTNPEGIAQLSAILGDAVDIHVVPLPEPDHPEDVFHLMSMISPLDADLALVYSPLIPETFATWLKARGVQLLDIPEKEYLAMGCNVLATGPRRVIMLDGLPLTRRCLEQAGCDVSVYKGAEISRKGEGGPTCLTRPLSRSK